MWHLWSYLDEGKHIDELHHTMAQYLLKTLNMLGVGRATPLRKVITDGGWKSIVWWKKGNSRTDLHRST